LIALAVGCFLVGDTLHRARAALDAAAEWWPWTLLALALLNLLRSVVPVDSLIGPAVLAVVAVCGLTVSRGLDTRAVQNLAVPLALAGSGAVLLMTSGASDGRTRWTGFLSTRRVHVPAEGGELLVFRAVCGELRADLRATHAGGLTSVHVTAVAGHVHLIVPRSWQVKVHASGALLTRVSETGRQDRRLTGDLDTPPHSDSGLDPKSGAQDEVAFHLLGICAAVSIAHV
jgi:hypothetical protein